ncbi:MAG: PQQ-dependent sugar dehydrogenase, partial [Roseococcus sp.]
MSGSVFLAHTEASVRENAGVLQVEIRRSGSLLGDVTLLFGVTGDSATEGLDFRLGGTGSLVMPAGLDHILIPVTILNDRLAEGTETATFSIISATGANLAAPRTQRISILDDEAPSPPLPAEPPLVSDYDVARLVVARGLNQPVHFSFSPLDPGLIYVGEKGGVLKLLDLKAGAATTLLDLSAQVNSTGDRGLMDVALHPDFRNHPYVYLFVVMDPPESAGLTGLAGPDGAGNRYSQLLRYTADAATGYQTLVPGSGVVLLGGAGHSAADISGGGALDFTDPAEAGPIASDRLHDPGDWVLGGFTQDYLKVDSRSHAGGRLLFGPDGMLYVTTGDGTSFNYADPRSLDAQSLDSLSGKVLRIDPLTGQGLADNPFAATAVSLDANQAKVFQLGLRNPFSASFSPDGALFIADVGWSNYEEINTGGPGANFGWPYFEGGDGGRLNRTIGYRDMPGVGAFYDAVAAGTISVTPAFRALAHDSAAPGFQAQAITAAAVIGPGSPYPAALQGDLVFADFVGGNLYAVETGNSASLRFLYDWGNSGPVHFLQGPDGFLYYSDLYTGQIGRLVIAPAGPIQPQKLLTLGAASLLDSGAGEYQITPEAFRQTGGVVSTTRVDLREDARFSFQMSFGDQEAGADGMGFVLHGLAMNALGSGGGNMGFRDLTSAIAVEFDIYKNSGDIVNDHSVIYAPGNRALGTGVKGAVDLGNIEDGRWHDVEITWNAATHTLATRFDGIARDSFTSDLVNTVLGGSPFAQLLIAGATGGLGTDQRLRGLIADVTYEDVAGNQAPVIFGGALPGQAVAENSHGPVWTPRASDAEHAPLVWSLAGLDAAAFTIQATTGALSFAALPDFEAPGDRNGDNLYEVTLIVTDPGGVQASQELRLTVTDTLNETLQGGAGAELLQGAGGADLLIGEGGADTLRGGAGQDTIRATLNDGNDLIQGDADEDTYSLEGLSAPANVSLLAGTAGSAETGRDRLSGIEHVIGGAGADSLKGDASANRLEGRDGNDRLEGMAGDDSLLGGAGADSLDGGPGADRLEGGAGDDLYVVEDVRDVILDVAGNDRVLAWVDWTLGAGLERLSLQGTAPLAGAGNALANRLDGNAGANRLEGGAGDDVLVGGAGDDTLLGGPGRDRLEGDAGADVFRFLSLSEGRDTITGYVAAED